MLYPDIPRQPAYPSQLVVEKIHDDPDHCYHQSQHNYIFTGLCAHQTNIKQFLLLIQVNK